MAPSGPAARLAPTFAHDPRFRLRAQLDGPAHAYDPPHHRVAETIAAALVSYDPPRPLATDQSRPLTPRPRPTPAHDPARLQRFQGLWTDPVTGIAYARARWYDARNASWLSEDPLGAVDSPNLYAFVGWQPQMARNPAGLAGIDPARPEWHHLLTQEEDIVAMLAEAGIDVNDKRFGVLVEAGAHRLRDSGAFYQGVENLHGSGWNEDVRRIVSRLRDQGKLSDVGLLAARLQRLMQSEKYRSFFKYSISAPMSYGEWAADGMKGRPKWDQYYQALRRRFAFGLQDILRRLETALARTVAREAAERGIRKAASKGSKRGARAIPIIGTAIAIWSFTSDTQALGLGGATANAAIDAVPLFGGGKSLVEMVSGRNLIASEDEVSRLRQQLAFLCYATGEEWDTTVVHPTLETLFYGSVNGHPQAIRQSEFLQRIEQLGLTLDEQEP